jgi:hypothetical protein
LSNICLTIIPVFVPEMFLVTDIFYAIS